jgi:hypothetical protein
MTWVRILSGNLAGRIRQMPDKEAENAIATGYVREASPAEYTSFFTQDSGTSTSVTDLEAAGAQKAPPQPTPAPSAPKEGDAGQSVTGQPAAPATGGAETVSGAATGLTAKKAMGRMGKWHVHDADGDKVNDKGLTEDEANARAATGRDPRAKAE